MSDHQAEGFPTRISEPTPSCSPSTVPPTPGLVPETVPPTSQMFSESQTPGLAVAGYVIEHELGRGGMGVVYRARQKGLNRLVALKMILHAGHVGAEEHSRFEREARVLAELRH